MRASRKTTHPRSEGCKTALQEEDGCEREDSGDSGVVRYSAQWKSGVKMLLAATSTLLNDSEGFSSVNRSKVILDHEDDTPEHSP